MRIIQQSLLFDGDEAQVQLAVATHARPSWPDNVGTPSGVPHVTVVKGIDRDSSINDRNQVRVGQRVEDCSRPRAINAREDQVMIKREPKSHQVHRWIDRKRVCRTQLRLLPSPLRDARRGLWDVSDARHGARRQ